MALDGHESVVLIDAERPCDRVGEIVACGENRGVGVNRTTAAPDRR